MNLALPHAPVTNYTCPPAWFCRGDVLPSIVIRRSNPPAREGLPGSTTERSSIMGKGNKVRKKEVKKPKQDKKDAKK